jgi:hypothetical protein
VIAGHLRDQRGLAGREPGQAGVEDEVARVLVVVVVVHRHADVVEHRRGPQQLALGRIALVIPAPASASNIWSVSARHVLDVPLIGVVLRGQVAHVVSRTDANRADRGREVGLEEHALAQALLGHLDRVEPPASRTASTVAAPARMTSRAPA